MGQEQDRIGVTLGQLTEAGDALELARQVVVLRAQVALAAGATTQDVARAAGVDPRTLRGWLTERVRPRARRNAPPSQ